MAALPRADCPRAFLELVGGGVEGDGGFGFIDGEGAFAEGDELNGATVGQGVGSGKF